MYSSFSRRNSKTIMDGDYPPTSHFQTIYRAGRLFARDNSVPRVSLVPRITYLMIQEYFTTTLLNRIYFEWVLQKREGLWKVCKKQDHELGTLTPWLIPPYLSLFSTVCIVFLRMYLIDFCVSSLPQEAFNRSVLY